MAFCPGAPTPDRELGSEGRVESPSLHAKELLTVHPRSFLEESGGPGECEERPGAVLVRILRVDGLPLVEFGRDLGGRDLDDLTAPADQVHLDPVQILPITGLMGERIEVEVGTELSVHSN